MVKPQMLRMGKWTYTREELDEMYAEADRRGREQLEREPLAVDAIYDAQTKHVVLTLNNGARFEFPVELLQRVADATEVDRAKITIFGSGTSVDWPSVDMQFEVTSLLAGRFGNRKWMEELRRRKKVGQPVATLRRQVSRRSPGASRVNKDSSTAAARGTKKHTLRSKRTSVAT